MSKFWNKVEKCKHDPTNYQVYIYCDTPYCAGSEWCCKHRGVYIQECGCGIIME